MLKALHQPTSKSLPKPKPTLPLSPAKGFTIVELLIVIVIIAILAVVTIVAYNGLQARARASSASSALSQAKKKLELYKVDTTTYPTTGNLAIAGVTDSGSTSFQYTSTGSTYCLTAVNGTISYYIDSSSQPTPTQGGCNGQTWPGGVAMTNLVSNGDFSNGTTGWSVPAGWTISGGVLSSTASGAGEVYTSPGSPPIVSSHIYYMSAVISSYTSGGTEIHLGGMATNPYNSASGKFSINKTSTAGANGNVVISRNAGAFMGSVDNVLCIDLTTTFGAGSEPTQAQMDAILQRFPNSWFNGTVTANTVGIL